MSADVDLPGLLARCALPPPGTTVRCGYSGGADSTGLLIVARAAGCIVDAVHVDHRLHPASAELAGQAAAQAKRLGFECTIVVAPVRAGPNLEARARVTRLAALGDGALTAHTADDRAETVLLNLLRGTGPDGLAALAPGPTKPLLAVRRHELAALVAAHGVDPVVDPTNTDPRFRRNRVRAELVPLLDDIAERDVVPLLTRLSDLAAADRRLLEALAEPLDPTDARSLREVAAPLAARAVRRWLEADGYPPDRAAIERVMDVIAGRAEACEIPGGIRVERRQQRLRKVPPAGRIRD